MTDQRVISAVGASGDAPPGSSRVSQFVLAAAVAATTLLQWARARAAIGDSDPLVTPGLDFHMLVWAPVRGLLLGFNPYANPPEPGYLQQLGPAGASPPRPPALLLLEGWLAAPAPLVGYLGSVVLNCLLLWAGLLLLARPRTSRQLLVAAAVGSAVLLAGPTDMVLGLGQVTPWAVLGLGLMLRAPQRWTGAFGLSLVLFLPQVGVPLSVMLLALGLWRLVVRGWLVSALLSLPAVALLVASSTGPIELLRSSLATTSGLAAPVNAANRVDLGGLLTAQGALSLLPGALVLLVCVVLLHRYRPPLDVTLLLGLTSAIAIGFYHMPYHLPLELTLAAALLVRGSASGRLQAAAGVFLALCVLTSAWLVEWWESAQGAASLMWPLLLVSLSVMPALLAVLAVGEAATHASARRRRPTVPAGIA